MKIETLNHNLAMLATHTLDGLTVAEDGETLVVSAAARAASSTDEAARKVLEVIGKTRAFCEQINRPIWVKLAEEGSLYGVPARVLLQKAQTLNYRPIEQRECEEHRKVIFVLREGEQTERVEADRELLREHSGMFGSMLGGSYRETGQREIRLQDVNPILLREFLGFLGGKEEVSVDPNYWIPRLRFANRLGSDAFIDYTAKKLFSTIWIDQLGDILENNEEIFVPLVANVEKEDWRLVAAIDRLIEKTERGEVAQGATPEEKMHMIHTAKTALVAWINKQKVQMNYIVRDRNVTQIIEWLRGTPLEYAWFTPFRLTNDERKKLIEYFPNIKHLAIPKSTINEEVLKQLPRGLLSLCIMDGNLLVGSDAQYLPPGLQTLDISQCRLGRGTLLHLPRGLQNLIMWGWGYDRLGPDELQHLPQGLRSLSIGSFQFRSDALLRLPPGLQSLSIQGCTQFVPGTLMHLPPGLQSLNIGKCDQFGPDDILHLPPGLLSLNMSWRTQFGKNMLRHLPLGLQRLNIAGCSQLGSDELQHLPPGLLSLVIRWCTQFGSDALKDLPPGLLYLDITGCRQFDLTAIPESLKGRLVITGP